MCLYFFTIVLKLARGSLACFMQYNHGVPNCILLPDVQKKCKIQYVPSDLNSLSEKKIQTPRKQPLYRLSHPCENQTSHKPNIEAVLQLSVPDLRAVGN